MMLNLLISYQKTATRNNKKKVGLNKIRIKNKIHRNNFDTKLRDL